MVSKTVSFLAICVMVLIGITKIRSHPLMESMTEDCYHEGEPYPVGDFVPSEDCTMLCVCNGYGPPSPCFPMCPPVRVPTCEVGEELYSYYEKNDYGCQCEKTACRELNDE